MTNAMNLINAALSAPKTHAVVTTYDCSMVRRHETRSMATAENFAVGERRKIGRDLISRNADHTAGPVVRVKSVDIIAL